MPELFGNAAWWVKTTKPRITDVPIEVKFTVDGHTMWCRLTVPAVEIAGNPQIKNRIYNFLEQCAKQASTLIEQVKDIQVGNGIVVK